MVSPLCEVKDGAGAYVSTTNGVNVTPGNTVTIHLIDSSASSWSISCIYTDDQSVAATVNSGLTVNSVARTATFTAPAAGRAYIFRSTVNGGVGSDGRVLSSYSATFGIYTLTSGLRVIAVNETTEGNESFGWTSVLNSIIRSGLGGVVLDTDNSTLAQSALEAETTDATPTTVSGSTVALATDTTTTVDVEARCIQAGASKTKVFNIRRHFLNDGGSITASTQETVSGPDEVGGTLAADVNIEYTGTNARVEVTGVAATDLRWRVDIQSVQLAADAVAPNLASISPSSGSIGGGTAVTLTGTGFTGATGATVGGVSLTSFTVVNDTTITGTTGAHAAGAVDVVVTGPGGTDTLVGGYTYSAAWTPASLGADLVAWYRADLGVTGSAPVTAWADQSGNGHNLAAGGNPSLNATDADFNNQASITLDGVGDYFQSGAFGATENVPFTVVMIFKQTGGTYLFDGIAAGFRAGIFNNAGDLSAFHQASATYMASGVAPSGAKQFMLAEFAADTVNSSMAVGQLTPQATYSTGDGSSGLTGVTVGDYYGAAAPMSGDVAEVIVIGKLLSGGEKTSLAGYVNSRYSMAIA